MKAWGIGMHFEGSVNRISCEWMWGVRERVVRDDSKIIGPNKWKDGTVINGQEKVGREMVRSSVLDMDSKYQLAVSMLIICKAKAIQAK